MIPPEIKPIIAAVSVLGTVTTIEFVLLVIAEFKDGNLWSAVTRIIGLVITGLVGLFIWRKFKAVRDKFTPDLDLDTLFAAMPEPETVNMPEPAVCLDCGRPMLTMFGEEAPDLCPPCWKIRVDNRLELLERRDI
jgi:hypothetical protein